MEELSEKMHLEMGEFVPTSTIFVAYVLLHALIFPIRHTHKLRGSEA